MSDWPQGKTMRVDLSLRAANMRPVLPY